MPESQAISFAVFTADRPELAAGCLSSYLSLPSLPASVIVMDDSRDEANVARTAKVTRNISARYAGRGERRRYAAELARVGILEDVAAFCLLGPDGDWFTAGASRNAALLDTVGEKIFMADDDTRGRTVVQPEHNTNVRLGGHEDPTDIRFFETRSAAKLAAEWKQVDLFGQVESFLGAGQGIIRLASCGVIGDSGFYSPAHLLWMASPETTARLRESDAVFSIALHSREVIRLVPEPTITRGTVCMATTLGLDNRQLLPPFLPVGRNEDGLFGNLMLRCFPEACTVHLPFGVSHEAPENRPYHRLPHEPQTIRLSELIILLLSACTADDFRALGAHLVEVSSSPERFVQYARQIVAGARSALLRKIEERWAAFQPMSPLWRTQTDTLRTRLQELIDSPDCWQPLELQDARETARIVALTGKLIAWWPDIVEAAGHLRAKGIRVSRD